MIGSKNMGTYISVVLKFLMFVLFTSIYTVEGLERDRTQLEALYSQIYTVYLADADCLENIGFSDEIPLPKFPEQTFHSLQLSDSIVKFIPKDENLKKIFYQVVDFFFLNYMNDTIRENPGYEIANDAKFKENLYLWVLHRVLYKIWDLHLKGRNPASYKVGAKSIPKHSREFYSELLQTIGQKVDYYRQNLAKEIVDEDPYKIKEEGIYPFNPKEAYSHRRDPIKFDALLNKAMCFSACVLYNDGGGQGRGNNLDIKGYCFGPQKGCNIFSSTVYAIQAILPSYAESDLLFSWR